MTSWWRGTGRRRIALYLGLVEPIEQERLSPSKRPAQFLAFVVAMIVVVLLVRLTR